MNDHLHHLQEMLKRLAKEAHDRRNGSVDWKKHPAKVNDSGETILHPCLEVECDLMANRAMRSVASLVKRYMQGMVGDVAVLIEKPYLQEEDEPRACLGMCRFDRIDVLTCPAMPPRKEHGDTVEQRDIVKASSVMGLPVGTSRIRSCIGYRWMWKSYLRGHV